MLRTGRFVFGGGLPTAYYAFFLLFVDGSHDAKQYPAEYLGHRRVEEKLRQRVNPV